MITNGVASEYDMSNKKVEIWDMAYKSPKTVRDTLWDVYQQGRADAERDFQNSDYWADYLAKVIADAKADAIEEFDRICEEARSHKFGVCDADFVIDVIKAKVKEQLKEQKNGMG